MRKKNIVIINYGLGNIFSILQALKAVGANAIVSSDAKVIKSADGLLLPGVGAFGNAIERLKRNELVEPILSFVDAGGPIMGVCLGMQLLFQRSDEFGEHQGLQLIEGTVERFPKSYQGVPLRVPFMGWNHLKFQSKPEGHLIFDKVKRNEKLYLVHSYVVVPKDPSIIIATCSYHGYSYPSIIKKDNIIGVQGHPEKSSDGGLDIFRSWLLSV